MVPAARCHRFATHGAPGLEPPGTLVLCIRTLRAQVAWDLEEHFIACHPLPLSAARAGLLVPMSRKRGLEQLKKQK